MRFPIVKMSDTAELTGRDFVGVSTGLDSKLQVTVPYGIDIPDLVDSLDVQNMRFLKTYVKAIQKALTDKSVRNAVENVTAGINHPLAAVNIIYDYITMGPLVEFETAEVLSNSGKMDINRTIQKVTPSFVNGNLIYDEYITRKRKVVHDNYVANVQGNIINHFMKNGGELLFGASVKVAVRPIALDKTVVLKLRKELNQTFNSRKLTVIRWMIDYLNGMLLSAEEKGSWNYAIIASSLWEVMVDAVFGNQTVRDKTAYGKKYAFYSLVEEKNVTAGRPTEHDTIYETEMDIIIVDAKMYGKDSNLLSEEVLGKQFGYYSEAKKKKPHKRIINVLLLPAMKAEDEGFSERIILDPHVDAKIDPDRIIYIYHYPANTLVRDYYYSKRRIGKLSQEFDAFIQEAHVRKFLDMRGTTY